jgi:hypothetical protein
MAATHERASALKPGIFIFFRFQKNNNNPACSLKPLKHETLKFKLFFPQVMPLPPSSPSPKKKKKKRVYPKI